MLQSQILVPQKFYTFYDSITGIERQVFIKIQFQQFSIHKIYVIMYHKLSELYCNVPVVLKLRGEGLEKKQKIQKDFFKLFFFFFYFLWPSPCHAENKNRLKCISDYFSCMVTYVLCMENHQNCILVHSCLPIVGRLS